MSKSRETGEQHVCKRALKARIYPSPGSASEASAALGKIQKPPKSPEGAPYAKAARAFRSRGIRPPLQGSLAERTSTQGCARFRSLTLGWDKNAPFGA